MLLKHSDRKDETPARIKIYCIAKASGTIWEDGPQNLGLNWA